MRRFLITAAAFVGAMGLLAGTAMADSPHFVSASVTSVTSNTATVSFRESGLDHSQNSVVISVSGTAECINPGNHHPKAANKASEGASGTFQVSNGTAAGSLTMTAANISPNCSPPMVIAWTDITVTDSTTGKSISIPGTFFPSS